MGTYLTELNVNPCKMCMPMGAVSALCGLKNCMTILHGSQGCATYIRRHMATHYNEPVDIASSSLTEQGTVFGGEANLIKGIENLISLYDPDIIGVATTCLAETIGENVEAIIRKFYAAHKNSKVKIINISSAGYGGTQYEGFKHALRAVVSQVEMDDTPNNKLNIIAPMLSPADCRALKSLLDSMGLEYILLPDLSDNLDGGFSDKYDKLKGGGISLSEISKMAGARHSIELSLFNSDATSPARFLYERYSVPFSRLALPIGLRDTDAFIRKLISLGGKLPEALVKERSRYLDAMIDSHKYSADGRASIFGEPDFVYSMTRLCCENGIVPVVAATGSVCTSFKEQLEPEIKKCSDRQLVDNTAVLDNCDFDTIESLSRQYGTNLMIGSSDGRRAARRLKAGLVRCAFPVHDRVGGQRIKTLLYEGSLNILDQAVNYLLSDKEEFFRDEIYEEYFKQDSTKKQLSSSIIESNAIPDKSISERTMSHPCFNCSGDKYARMHLPIAPHCNIQCNYCVRQYNCPNESRPGVTTEVLSPDEALNKYIHVKEKLDNTATRLTVVGIAGPGDALADFKKTREALRLIREYDSEVTFCLSTNGLLLPQYANELIKLGVTHVTVTMNSVDSEIGAKIYKYVDYMGTRFTGAAAASILMTNQLAGIRRLASCGIIVKVNIVMLRGINDDHIENVVLAAKEAGAYMTNIMQLIPVKGSAFDNVELVSNQELNAMRKKCEGYIKQMYHCRQCRADAIGTLDDDISLKFRAASEQKREAPAAARKYAVATKSGLLVDQHFGHADEFYIYEFESDKNMARFIQKRRVSKYCSVADECGRDKDSKIDTILAAVSDCDGVFALRIGDSPAEKLKSLGIRVFTTYDRIEDAIKKAALAI